TLADRSAGDVDILTNHEVIGRQFRADRNERILRYTELRDLALRLDLALGKVAAHRLGDILRLARADTELQRLIAVLVGRAVRDDLAIVELQHRDRHVLAPVREDAGHAELLCDYAGAHDPIRPSRLRA